MKNFAKMSDLKTPVINRLDAIGIIKEESTLIAQLFYNKRTKTSWEFRSKNSGSFILVTYDNGEKGFDIYYQSRKNNIAELMEQFDSL